MTWFVLISISTFYSLDFYFSATMALRLFNDDFLFRRPLIDRFFDDDDFYLFDRVGDSLTRLLRERERELAKKRDTNNDSAGNNTNPNGSSATNPADGNTNNTEAEVSNDQVKSNHSQPASSGTVSHTSSSSCGPLSSFYRGAFGLMSTDLIESEHDFQIHVDLPGVQAEDLDVSVEEKYLVLKAERKHVHENKNDKVHSMERSYGTLQRKIRIPQNADMDGANVKLRNGVLSITIPKKAPAPETVRKLSVNVENAWSRERPARSDACASRWVGLSCSSVWEMNVGLDCKFVVCKS